MKQRNRFVFDMLDQDLPSAAGEIVRRQVGRSPFLTGRGRRSSGFPTGRRLEGIFLSPDPGVADRVANLRVSAYGDEILRLTAAFGSGSPTTGKTPCSILTPGSSRESCGHRKAPKAGKSGTRRKARMRLSTRDGERHFWSKLQPEPETSFDAVVFPDGRTAVPFAAFDEFFPKQPESFSWASLSELGGRIAVFFSLQAAHDEKFAGQASALPG